MCKCICMWGPEVNFKYCSLGTTHHVFDKGSLTGLKLAKCTQAGWQVSPRLLQCLPAQCWDYNYAPSFPDCLMWVLWVEFTPLHWHDKHFTN